ncbi:MAG: NADH:flavin oxidoreductase [Bacteroidales bacterium]|nr:NADH:flavin oxidoreductase [Bacteroidales bacterium]MDD4670625.1 NADH:flavin oxidoreductase [Bacteroidales bacterium]
MNASDQNTLFTPFKLGPITLRNRTIRSAAFEGMCPGNRPSQELFDYHTAVARGGIGMTTVAYASVSQSGLSFERQLWMREEIVPELRQLTDAIHKEGALASIQLGHCGNMSHRYICKCMPKGASRGFNIYSPTFVHKLSIPEIEEIVSDYGKAVILAKKAGFDAVEIHAGHGYLISQFLSPYTNHRKDRFGGKLEQRMLFMEMVMKEVVAAAGNDLAIFVKTNTRDGFRGGLEVEDCIKVAKRLQELGAQALVLSGGFVSRAPMYVMGGDFPKKAITHYMPMKQWWLKLGVGIFGTMMAPSVPFKENYFLENSKRFRAALDIPLVYVGGAISRKGIDEVLDAGFEMVQMGRALIRDTDFVNKLKDGDKSVCSECEHVNFCVGRMYTLSMQCHTKCADITPALERDCCKRSNGK